MTQKNQQVSLLEVAGLKESLKLITVSLEKGCKAGNFNLDESYLLKISLNNMERAIDNLDELQKMFVQISKQREQKEQQKQKEQEKPKEQELILSEEQD